MIRTLVSASSVLARAGLAAIVRGDSRLSLVGEASPEEIERRIAEIDPDVVLEQHDRRESVRLSSVALVDDPHDVWLAGASPREAAAGYAVLSRDASGEEIAAAIVAVAAGLVAVQPRALVTAGAGAGSEKHDAERLTPREVDVLHELARGVPNKTIAARLSISEHTVKFHIASIFAKLGVASRTEAVTQGVRLGLVML